MRSEGGIEAMGALGYLLNLEHQGIFEMEKLRRGHDGTERNETPII
jgi:hypothetical protein